MVERPYMYAPVGHGREGSRGRGGSTTAGAEEQGGKGASSNDSVNERSVAMIVSVPARSNAPT